MRCARDRGRTTSDPSALTDPKAMAETDRGESPLLSIVVPVRNEAGNVAPLIAEALGAVFDDTSVSDIFDGENLA